MKLVTLAAMVVVLAVGGWAASAAPKAKTPIEELQTQIDNLRDQVRDLSLEVKSLREQLNAMPPPPKAAKAARDEIVAALNEKRLATGMTLAEAEQAMGEKGKLTGEVGHDKTYEWDVVRTVDRQAGYLHVVATILDGQVIAHQSSFSPAAAPRSRGGFNVPR